MMILMLSPSLLTWNGRGIQEEGYISNISRKMFVESAPVRAWLYPFPQFIRSFENVFFRQKVDFTGLDPQQIPP